MRDDQPKSDAARQRDARRPAEPEIQDLTSDEAKPTEGGEAKGGALPSYLRRIQDSED